MRPVVIIAALCFGYLEAQNDSLVVATVGEYLISSNDLLTSYEFGPAFVKRNNDPLREHLKYMIYERLLALEATANGLNKSEFVQERVKGLEEDGAVEQLYRNDILSQVKLSQEQIERDVQKAKVTVSLRWIFNRTKNETDVCQRKLSNGASFDSLFSFQIDPVSGIDGRSLETTLLKLERDNEEFAKSISLLKVGESSQPIQGKDGYYIVHLDKAWQNPLTTVSDYAELKNQAIEIRTKIISDRLADTYVKNIMKSHDPVIKADGFNILRAHIASKGLSHDAKVKWEIPSTFMTEAGPQPIGNSEHYLNKTLVTFGNRSLTIRDYVRWYDIRQFQFDTRSLTAFNSSVKKTIWKMVQDKLLSEEAYRRGLDRNPVVAHETKKWEAKLLYLAQRSALMRSIPLSDSALRSYFNKHKKKYGTPKRRNPKFSDVKEAVSSDFFYEQESQVLLKATERLKQKYSVTINEHLLKELSKSVPSDSRAIEMMFYKPGGAFPRVAFPTIDEAWSRMQ